jgi:Spy/CpxP family protein refolding chaperone
MKKIIMCALIAVAVAGSASAQDQQPRREGFGRHHYGFSQLNLTDEQKAEMKTINEDFKKQMTDLQKNEDITVREWKSKMKTIREDHKTKVQQVLTAEQKASMEKLRKDRKGKMHKRGKQNMDSLKKELNLTAEQESALKQQRTEMMQKFKAIREDKSLTEEQKKTELKKFREQQHQSLKSILTEEQINKLQQKKSHRQKPVL